MVDKAGSVLRQLLEPAESGKPRTAVALLLIVLAVAVVLVDKVRWASVSEWREDQATNIWLGYTRSPLEAPVGLVNSVELPNPNGLVLASEMLSRLPNLWCISTVLGVLQTALMVWACWLATKERSLFLITIGPLLSSIVLRGTSVEFVAQWSLIPLNLVFFAGILIYLRRRSMWVMPLFVALLLACPSIYLAGLANSIVCALIITIVMARNPPGGAWRSWIAPLVVSGVVVCLSIWLTWLPYFSEVGLNGIRRASVVVGLAPMERLLAMGETIIRFPIWSLSQYGTSRAFPAPQVDAYILSQWTFSGYQLSLRILFVQGFICYIAILIAGASRLLSRQPLSGMVSPGRVVTGRALILMAVFVILVYISSPLLGGFVWARNQRLDQAVQVLPFLLILWFLTPPLLELSPIIKKAAFTMTCITSIAYTALSLPVGYLVVRENLLYEGSVLAADVPLVDKLRVAMFIAQDWKSQSSSLQVPVDYDLGGGRWDWVPAFGAGYLKWYPAPYTIGRAFDYLLLRQYGLSNSQEGVQLRSFGTGRYLVTYAFKPSPAAQAVRTRDYEFGRLRVTVVGTNP